jgi:hypothetical protein
MTQPRSNACRGVLRALVAASVAVVAPLVGQPAADSAYDFGVTTEIRGEVAQFSAVAGGDAVLLVFAPDSNGVPRQWTVTLGKASELRRAGMTPFTFAPGVKVSIMGNPAASTSERRILAQKATTSGFGWSR